MWQRGIGWNICNDVVERLRADMCHEHGMGWFGRVIERRWDDCRTHSEDDPKHAVTSSLKWFVLLTNGNSTRGEHELVLLRKYTHRDGLERRDGNNGGVLAAVMAADFKGDPLEDHNELIELVTSSKHVLLYLFNRSPTAVKKMLTEEDIATRHL
ncbi:hypothetical protein Syun_009523 [Stephania yunnanensis]|uniref:Uncharacterized protein n=1 Tax=Stephania yunnanensis TaxID=152371 RepID=A0AAP0KGT8_9MAGN